MATKTKKTVKTEKPVKKQEETTQKVSKTWLAIQKYKGNPIAEIVDMRAVLK